MNSPSTESSPAPRSLVIAAFLTIYLVWGSTYLGIRVAIETLPPFLMAGARFLIAGAALFAWLWFRGTPMPSRVHWRNGAVAGVLLLLGGNGLVAWAEQTVSSGLASLLIALAPVWFALLEWLRPGGMRPQAQTIGGIVVGFGGVALLVTAADPAGTHGAVDMAGAVALILAGLIWAGGSLFSRYADKAPSAWMNAAIQMICGGGALLLTGWLTGETGRLRWEQVSFRSAVAFAYLIVFGSWIGFSAYIWLLKVSTPARVATYAYVNPMIAVFLGWALLDEPVILRMLGAAFVILAGVVITTLPPTLAQSLVPRGLRPKSEAR